MAQTKRQKQEKALEKLHIKLSELKKEHEKYSKEMGFYCCPSTLMTMTEIEIRNLERALGK